ncbi:MAG: hypothetical protein SGARI_002592 [Bacillariaceae sp.]
MMPLPNNQNLGAAAGALDGPFQPGDYPIGDGDADIYVLPPGFAPGGNDVICQRGKECFEHLGNRRFRLTIDNHLDKYMEVKSRQQKSKIVSTIVDGIKKSVGEEGGGFVRKIL